MIGRRAFLVGGTGALLAPELAWAQAPGRVYRIGWLSAGSSELSRSYLVAFRSGLAELGWTEGANYRLEYYFADGDMRLLARMATRLAGTNPDVIIAVQTPAAVAAKNSTSAIPIILTNVSDPVMLGMIKSFARPGGNVTGVSNPNTELAVKRFQLLKEAFPSLKRVGVWQDPMYPTGAAEIAAILASAQKLGVDIHTVAVGKAASYDRAAAEIQDWGADSILVMPNVPNFLHRKRIIERISGLKLPAMYWRPEFVEVGGLMSYGANVDQLYYRAASYANKILKGATPGDLPVELPTRIDLAINLKTAKRLGLKFPDSILVRADEVIR